MVTSTSHDRVVRGRRPQRHLVAAAQCVDGQRGLVEEQNLRPGVDRHGEVLHAISAPHA